MFNVGDKVINTEYNIKGVVTRVWGEQMNITYRTKVVQTTSIYNPEITNLEKK